MKLTPRYVAAYVAAIAPIAVVGFAGTFVGHLAVLVVTLGIFFGTLSLGRQASPGGSVASLGAMGSVGSAMATRADSAPSAIVATSAAVSETAV